MARGKAIDDRKREHIKALLATGKSKQSVADEVGVSWATVDKISKEDPDGIEDLRENKRNEFIDALWDTIVSAQELGVQMIAEAKTGQRDIPLGQISTFLGTLYDKRALMLGESTANTTTTVKLEGELSEWAN